MLGLPLSHGERFTARVQRGNRVQVPVLIRWRHRLDPGEVLDVYLSIVGEFGSERFYVRLHRDGRFTIPKIVVEKLGIREGSMVEVMLEASVGSFQKS